jgi:hypothetical protein
MVRRTLLTLCTLAWGLPAYAQQQTPAAPASSRDWSLDLSAAWYMLPDESDYVQPTARLDWKRLHLETRYAYEDRKSLSFFAGPTFEFGDTVTVSVTPMIGGVVGDLDGVIPAAEATLSWRRLEAYGEAEYVFDLNDSSSKFFYMWSEVSVWATDWLRAGVVTQRTRTYRADREVQRGLLAGVAVARVNGTFYWFNPGADDGFGVFSVGVSW